LISLPALNRMKKSALGLKSLDDVIAEDCWSYVTNTGQSMISRIRVGRPQPWPKNEHGDWICPVEIEHYTGGVLAIAGVGPVDALMNALVVLKGFANAIGNIVPRAELLGSPRPGQKRMLKRRTKKRQTRQ
jgi:hypothetical protein